MIGNSAYRHSPKLQNPRNDATDMAVALKSLGFTVTQGLDLGRSAMARIIQEFALIRARSSVAVFFYAGHGLQVDGHNYLVPVDAKLTDASSLDFELVKLDSVQRIMERAGEANLLFLDACRDNPLARTLAQSMGTRSTSIGRGLAPTESGAGTLISFSTQPGNVALDGSGRNSPFAGALVRQLLTASGDLADMLISVRREVMLETANKQVPWEHSALTARISLKPASVLSPEPSFGHLREKEAELALWNAVKDSTQPALVRSYIQAFPTGMFVTLAQTIIAELEKPEIATPKERAITGNCNIANNTISGTISLDCAK